MNEWTPNAETGLSSPNSEAQMSIMMTAKQKEKRQLCMIHAWSEVSFFSIVRCYSIREKNSHCYNLLVINCKAYWSSTCNGTFHTKAQQAVVWGVKIAFEAYYGIKNNGFYKFKSKTQTIARFLECVGVDWRRICRWCHSLKLFTKLYIYYREI